MRDRNRVTVRMKREERLRRDQGRFRIGIMLPCPQVERSEQDSLSVSEQSLIPAPRTGTVVAATGIDRLASPVGSAMFLAGFDGLIETHFFGVDMC